MQPVLFRLPFLDWPVFAYPTLMALGFVAAIAVAMRLSRRRGIDPVLPLDLGLIALVSGLFGAHLFYYVEFYEIHFATRPWWAALAFWEGGLVFYGGVIGAFAAASVYLGWFNHRARREGRKPVHWLEMADVAAVALPLGLAFGRVGCFLNGCCWGRPSTLPFPLALRFPRGSLAWERQLEQGLVAAGQTQTLPVYATQLYASVAAFLLFLVLWRVWLHRPAPGRVLAAFLALYGPVRFLNEGLRSHHPNAEMTHPFGTLHLTWSQIVSLVLFFSGLTLWFFAGRLKRRRQTQPTKPKHDTSASTPSSKKRLDMPLPSD